MFLPLYPDNCCTTFYQGSGNGFCAWNWSYKKQVSAWSFCFISHEAAVFREAPNLNISTSFQRRFTTFRTMNPLLMHIMNERQVRQSKVQRCQSWSGILRRRHPAVSEAEKQKFIWNPSFFSHQIVYHGSQEQNRSTSQGQAPWCHNANPDQLHIEETLWWVHQVQNTDKENSRVLWWNQWRILGEQSPHVDSTRYLCETQQLPSLSLEIMQRGWIYCRHSLMASVQRKRGHKAHGMHC